MKKLLRNLLKRVLIDVILTNKGKWGGWWNYKYGFLKSTVDVCGINKENYKEFLSDRDYRMTHPINGAYSSIIDNKLWLPMLLHEYQDLCPKYYFFKDQYGFLDLLKGCRVSFDIFLEKLKKNGKVACKHTHSSLGKGFFILEYREGCFFINNEHKTVDQIRKTLNVLEEYIFTEYVHQHSYAQEIAPESLNTLRLLTVLDKKSKTCKIVRGFHRFGCNNSIVDNLGHGNGVLCYLDIDTGKLTGEGVMTIDGKEKVVSDIVHPNSKVSLSGLGIPDYHSICDQILRIANDHAYLKYVGWDIAITEDNFKIIETNSLSSLNVIQQRKGFLIDPVLKEYFK